MMRTSPRNNETRQ